MDNNFVNFLDTEKTILFYKNNRFQYDGSGRNKTLIYKCSHKNCLAKVKLDEHRAKIVSCVAKHDNHPKLTSPANRKKATPSTPTRPTSKSSNDKDTLQSCDSSFISTTPNAESDVVGGAAAATGPINIAVQTDESWEHMKTGLVDKIIAQEMEITTLNTQIKSLEYQIMLRDSCECGPAPKNSTCSMSVATSHVSPAMLPQSRAVSRILPVKSLHNLSPRSLPALGPVRPTMPATPGLINPVTVTLASQLTTPAPSFNVTSARMISISKLTDTPMFPSNKLAVHHPVRPAGKVFLLGDSHVRGMSQELSTLLPSTRKVECFFQPGAGYNEVAQVHVRCPNLMNPKIQDIVVIFCGTNDIQSSQWSKVTGGLNILVEKFKHCQKFCIVGVPMRLDSKKLNSHIAKFNTKLKYFVKSKLPNLNYINPFNCISRSHYTRDGIHLNKTGKSVLCRKIANMVFHQFYRQPESVNLSLPEVIVDGACAKILTPHVNPHSISISNSTYQEMNSYLNKFYTDSDKEKALPESNMFLCSPIPSLQILHNDSPMTNFIQPSPHQTKT